MNSALAEAAEARVDDVLPLQEQLHELLGMPAAVAQDIERRRVGRPPGARNKRQAEVSALVRERFGDVLLQQVAVATMPLDHLLALGLKVSEALAEKRLAAANVLPYLEQRQPLRVDLTGKPPIFLTLELTQGNQGVGDGAAVQLDSAELDAAAIPLFSHAEPQVEQLIADQAPPALPAPPAAEPAHQAPAIEPAAADAPATPRGAVSTPPRPLRAPAGVVPPHPRIFAAAPNLGPTGPGVGGVAP